MRGCPKSSARDKAQEEVAERKRARVRLLEKLPVEIVTTRVLVSVTSGRVCELPGGKIHTTTISIGKSAAPKPRSEAATSKRSVAHEQSTVAGDQIMLFGGRAGSPNDRHPRAGGGERCSHRRLTERRHTSQELKKSMAKTKRINPETRYKSTQMPRASVPTLFILLCFLVIANTNCDHVGNHNSK